MNDEELTKLLEDANAGRISDQRINWEMCAGRIAWDGDQYRWVEKISNPLWDQIEKEAKSGGDLYQRLLKAGYFESNFGDYFKDYKYTSYGAA